MADGDESFTLTVAAGASGGHPRSWRDSQVWRVPRVRPTDTLAQLLEKVGQVTAGAQRSPASPGDLLVSAMAAPTQTPVGQLGRLPDPRPEATLAENGITSETVLRWFNGMLD